MCAFSIRKRRVQQQMANWEEKNRIKKRRHFDIEAHSVIRSYKANTRQSPMFLLFYFLMQLLSCSLSKLLVAKEKQHWEEEETYIILGDKSPRHAGQPPTSTIVPISYQIPILISLYQF